MTETTDASAHDFIRLMLADEMGTDPVELAGPPLMLTEGPPRRGPLARRFSQRTAELQTVSVGVKTVITASSGLIPEMRSAFEGCDARTALEPRALGLADAVLRNRGLKCGAPQLRLTCGRETFRHRTQPPGVELEIVERPTADKLAELPAVSWPNAIPARLDPARPIEVLVTAQRGGAVVGVATTRADSERVCQLGVDVTQDARHAGVGAAIVSAVTDFILSAGHAPLYGLFFGNVPSVRTALSLGYKPVFLEVISRPL